MSRDPVVAVGLLTARDLELLGTGFRRVYALPEQESGAFEDLGGFEDLLRALDKLDAVPPAAARRGR